MQKDPYLVLGVASDASQEEINNAYQNLKSRYKEEIFEEGEIGHQATKKLAEIESAYQECLDNIHRNIIYQNTGSGYGEIEDLIRNGKLEDAQNNLDKIESRDAEWHYLQAIIYYKRNWHVESKKQLEIALALDGSNQKYQGALDRLNKVIDGAGQNGKQNASANQTNSQNQRGGYARPQSTGGASNADACCNTCNCLICSDCCCECCGGDLIPCC